MSAEQFRALEHQIDQLIYRCNQLEQENRALRNQEGQWRKERTRLVEKNELARTRVRPDYKLSLAAAARWVDSGFTAIAG